MLATALVRAIGGENLHLRFKAGRHLVEVVERPAISLPAVEVEGLIDACQTIVRTCLKGETLDYGLFSPDREAWRRSVITLVRDAVDGKPIAFNAMPLLPVTRSGQREHLLHLGLVMVDPSERGEGLSWILYGLTCFTLFLRDGLRPLWISSVTQVPAVVGMVAETFAKVYPGQEGTPQTFAHRHLAHQIMAHERDAFGVGADAGYDPVTQVITNAYTGGSDNLKKTFAIAAKHRNERYNRFCAENLDYERGDDVLQIGCLDLTTARRYLVRVVPPRALPGLAVQMIFVACNAVLAPTMQWLNTRKPYGRLRPLP
jgi:hypothetical protein